MHNRIGLTIYYPHIHLQACPPLPACFPPQPPPSPSSSPQREEHSSTNLPLAHQHTTSTAPPQSIIPATASLKLIPTYLPQSNISSLRTNLTPAIPSQQRRPPPNPPPIRCSAASQFQVEPAKPPSETPILENPASCTSPVGEQASTPKDPFHAESHPSTHVPIPQQPQSQIPQSTA
jgi:hypothetical protein